VAVNHDWEVMIAFMPNDSRGRSIEVVGVERAVTPFLHSATKTNRVTPVIRSTWSMLNLRKGFTGSERILPMLLKPLRITLMVERMASRGGVNNRLGKLGESRKVLGNNPVSAF
jgi:hypothetical protein